MFYQRDRHGPGYSKLERRGRRRTEIEVMNEAWNNTIEGLKMIPEEWEKWKEEKRIDLQGNRILDLFGIILTGHSKRSLNSAGENLSKI